MNEILPGVFHWTARHPKIGAEVSSYFIAESGTVIDPMSPPDVGMGWFEDAGPVQLVALTNRHHDREAAAFVDQFGLGPVLVPDPGLYEFTDKALDVRGYAPGEEIIPGILAHEVGAICADEMALEIRSAGALALADGLIHFDDGVRFVRDDHMDDPERTKRELRGSLERLLDVDFDTLLFAHGQPIVGGGKQVLREFLAAAGTA